MQQEAVSSRSVLGWFWNCSILQETPLFVRCWSISEEWLARKEALPHWLKSVWVVYAQVATKVCTGRNPPTLSGRSCPGVWDCIPWSLAVSSCIISGNRMCWARRELPSLKAKVNQDDLMHSSSRRGQGEAQAECWALGEPGLVALGLLFCLVIP